MLKPVYALVGTDLFLQLDALAELLRAAPPDVQRIDVEGETAQLADVLDELRSFAMFSSRKIVIIRDADDFVSRFRQSLENYVAKPTAESSLVLRLSSLPSNQRIHKAIAAIGQIHNCNPPKDVAGWIMQRARGTHKLSLDPDAAAVLFDLIGNDLGRLDNELAKLALQTQGTVDASAIEQTVSFQREQEMWHLTDALGVGNISEALRRWRHLVQLDSSAEFRAVTWLCIWLEKVRKALIMKKQGKNEFAIARDLKIWPASQQKAFFQTAAAIGEAGAARLINLLADIDYRSKSGLGEMADNVERFLLSVR
ncbi:MAG: DNA polymerase III subunit delta [Planctomycetota bacterium]|nr:DNA polymerase III subunit delta [Planctomycetota bacterium]